MAETSTVSFIHATAGRQEVEVGVHDYLEAGNNKVSLAQHLMMKYPVKTVSDAHGNVEYPDGSTLDQFAMSAGIRVRPDPARGIQASSMHEIIHGTGHNPMYGGVVVRPQGNQANTAAARILFPEVVLQMVNDVLLFNKDDYLTPWEAAIALKTNVTSPRVDQPRINVTNSENSAAQPISQLAEPAVMVSITLNQKSYTIPTKSIGMQISDEALSATTIDLVALTLAAQARGERIRRIEADMAAIINGDVDSGVSAVTFVNASTFDSSIPGTNRLTNKAWFKWLRSNYQKMSVTNILTTDDGALDIDSRVGRPTVFGDTSADPNRLPGAYRIDNIGVPEPSLLLLPASIVGADRIVGFDRRYALHQITNLNASYSAIEQFVLRRASGMRFDYGTALFKLNDEAFSGLVIAA